MWAFISIISIFMSELIILGAGGHGAEVATYARNMPFSLLGAVDDGQPRGPWQSTNVIGGLQDLPAICAAHREVRYITAFGSNILRKKIVHLVEQFGIANLKPVTLRHERAWIGHDVRVEDGTLLAPDSLITTRAIIGRHCILNVKASVSHDCVVGDWCNINPGATLCGDVQLGEGCYIGAGATVIEKCRIGAWTTVGAGAVVTKNLPDGVIAVGVPARIIKKGDVARVQNRSR